MIERLLTEAALPHWQAAAAERFVLPECRACATAFWPPAAICPHCLDRNVTWQETAGGGAVTGWCVFHRPYLDAPWLTPPYTVVLVRLDAGPMMFSNLIGAEPEVGQRVSPRFETVAEGLGIVRFAPSA